MTTNRNPASTSATQGTAPRRPPKALFKYVMNPAMTLLLRSPLHRRISGSLALLSYTGRKSGKRFTTPVGYHRAGQHILVFTHSPWWKNFEGGAPVTMLIEGKEVQGHAEAIRDPDQIFTHVEPLVRKYGAKQARRMALTLDPGREPTADELRAAIGAQELIMLRIRPQNA
jgi:hypothetical protein